MTNQIIAQGYIGSNLIITQGYSTGAAVLGGDSFYFYFGAGKPDRKPRVDYTLINLVKKYLESIQNA